jgi:hypothetical protein
VLAAKAKAREERRAQGKKGGVFFAGVDDDEGGVGAPRSNSISSSASLFMAVVNAPSKEKGPFVAAASPAKLKPVKFDETPFMTKPVTDDVMEAFNEMLLLDARGNLSARSNSGRSNFGIAAELAQLDPKNPRAAHGRNVSRGSLVVIGSHQMTTDLTVEV